MEGAFSIIEPNESEFGVYFNVPNSFNFSLDSVYWYPPDDPVFDGKDYKIVFPEAIKFTFTLYDSKGIIKNGKKFTHIVYIGDWARS